jgi:hypothetical protein
LKSATASRDGLVPYTPNMNRRPGSVIGEV